MTNELSYAPESTNIPIAQGVSFTSDFTDVLFYPPTPVTMINAQLGYGGNFEPASGASHVVLSTVDGRNTATISINGEGQVSF
jgi:hypothetical protein